MLSTPLALLLTLLVPPLGPSAGKLPIADVVPPLEKMSDGASRLTLHQRTCLFVEGEPDALPYRADSPLDCERVNRASADSRKKIAKRLRLRAGKYQIRVLNEGHPFATGFVLRGEYDQSLPTVTGEGISTGSGRDFKIELTPGEYVYFCPVAKTLKYRLLVER